MTKEKLPGDEETTDPTSDDDEWAALFSSDNTDQTISSRFLSDNTEMTDFTDMVKKAMSADESDQQDSDTDSIPIQTDKK